MSRTTPSASRQGTNALGVSFPIEGIAQIELRCTGTPNLDESAAALTRILAYLSQDPTISAIVMVIVGPTWVENTTNAATRPEEHKFDVIQPLNLGKHSRYAQVAVVSVLQGTINNRLALQVACSSDMRLCTHDAQFWLGHLSHDAAAAKGPSTCAEALKDMPPALRLLDSVSLFGELLIAGTAVTADDARGLGFVSEILKSWETAVGRAQRVAEGIALRARHNEKQRDLWGRWGPWGSSGVVEGVSKL